jgi:hypothetical protein
MGIQKSGKGYKNVSPTTGKSFSKKPLTKAKARKQQEAIKASQARRGK